MNKQNIQNGIQTIVLDSWKEFHELNQDDFIHAPALVFRGHADAGWKLLSSLDRWEEKYPKRKCMGGGAQEFFDSPPFTTDQHLDAFKRAIRGRLDPAPVSLTCDDDYWALAQHHGLVTPLLDWTRSPYIALFFAFLEAVDQQVEYRSVYALSTSILLDNDCANEQPDGKVRLVSPSMNNRRLIAQSGLFTYLPRGKNLFEYIRTKYTDNELMAYLTHIKIPNKERSECLVSLNKMNINYLSLFPDLDGAAKHVNSLWQPGHEDSIAYV